MDDKNYWKDKWATKGQKGPNLFAKRAYAVMKKKRVKTVLDLGSGDGRDSQYFAGKGLIVYAFDFSRSGIAKLKKDNPEVKAVLGDIKKLPFKSNSFNAIYAHLSLHYFTNAETKKIFTKLHRILKKGGLLFVKCKSTNDRLYGKGKKIGPDMYQGGHTRHFFSKEYMAEQLKAFKILSNKKTSAVYSHYKSSFIEAVATK